MPLISFAEVRQQVSLLRVLDLLDYRWLKRRWGQCYGPCPLGCSSKVTGCSFNLGRSLWNCHRCGRGGDQLRLWMEAKRLSIYPAAVDLCRRLAIAVPYLIRRAKK